MSIGIYIHIPFCAGKCPYCDFYSVAPTDELCERYTSALISEITRVSEICGDLTADTVYFGGGTPPMLGADNLTRLLDHISARFRISPGAEITVEVNPRGVSPELMTTLHRGGFNRLSMGVQSGEDSELAVLGRRHTAAQAKTAVDISRRAGFDNISLDLMLAVSGQTNESLARSVDFLAGCEPEHISAYILKIEEGTPYASRRDALRLPDDDGQADLYLLACDLLEQRGYAQYEISNFAKPGRESRHNLKYWNGDEYLGFGPAAHSFFGGRRFYYPRDLARFLSSPEVIDDGAGGDCEEYAMLRLRLTDGLREDGYRARFGIPIPAQYRIRAQQLARAGLAVCDADGIRLTRQGMPVSNAAIVHILG